MSIEFDHVFVCTQHGAPEADLLSGAGFTEGQPNMHVGQGSSCRRFFFRNAYLELIWVHDVAEASRDVVAALGLCERSHYARTSASPFGIGLRAGREVQLPFATWSYQAKYLAAGDGLEIVTAAHAYKEPLVFLMRGGMRPDQYPATRRQPLDHPCRAEEITGLQVTVDALASSFVSALESVEMISCKRDGMALGELELDGGRQGRSLDLRPAVPLMLRW
jgi:hypothetical protein